MTTLEEVMAKLEQVEAQLVRLTEDLRRREELFAVRLQESGQRMRDDFASLLRSAGASEDQVIAALEAFDEEPLERMNH
jgi:hypothetical protein